LLRIAHTHGGGVWAVTLAADGHLVASGSDDGTVCLAHISGGQRPMILRAHTSTVHSVALASDARLLASGSGDGSIRLWEISSGRLAATLHGHTSTVFGVSLSADGQLLASGGGDRTTRLWETSSGMCVATLQDEACYQRLDITGLTGMSDAQRVALLALGAVEHSEPWRSFGRGPRSAHPELSRCSASATPPDYRHSARRAMVRLRADRQSTST
jgi:WD40 repeat protein